MRCTKNHTQITRRSFVAASISTPAMALVVPADPHPEWLKDWRAIRDDMNTGTDELDGDDPRWKPLYGLQDQIIGTKAQTREGVTAQIEFLIRDQRDYLKFEYGEDLLTSILNGLGGKAL